MRKTLFIFITCVLLFFVDSPPAVAQDFRGASWGMTKEEVKQDENLDLIQEDEKNLVYVTAIGGIDCLLIYNFVDDRLYNAMYWMIDEHAIDNGHIDDYRKLKNMLMQKYGTPNIDDEIWGRSLYKDEPDRKGFAISIGDLTMLAEWETENTEISIMLWGDNYDIKHAITYESKEYGTIAEKQKAQSELDKL